MRLLLLIIFILIFHSGNVSATPTGSLDFSQTNRLIDFGIFYPWVQLEPDVERRMSGKRKHLGAGGVSYTYQFFPTRHFGLAINPSASFVMTRIGKSKEMFYAINLEGGPIARLFPKSYFDPSIFLLSGVARVGSGGQYKSQFSIPTTGKLHFNLWRQQDPFQDYSLAFSTWTGAKYYFRPQGAMAEPWILEFGVAFRGSF